MVHEEDAISESRDTLIADSSAVLTVIEDHQIIGRQRPPRKIEIVTIRQTFAEMGNTCYKTILGNRLAILIVEEQIRRPWHHCVVFNAGAPALREACNMHTEQATIKPDIPPWECTCTNDVMLIASSSMCTVKHVFGTPSSQNER